MRMPEPLNFLLEKIRELLFYGNEYQNPGGASGHRMGDRGSILIKEQIRIAAGQKLSYTQEDVRADRSCDRVQDQCGESGERISVRPRERSQICIFREERGSGLIQRYTVAIRSAVL